MEEPQRCSSQPLGALVLARASTLLICQYSYSCLILPPLWSLLALCFEHFIRLVQGSPFLSFYGNLSLSFPRRNLGHSLFLFEEIYPPPFHHRDCSYQVLSNRFLLGSYKCCGANLKSGALLGRFDWDIWTPWSSSSVMFNRMQLTSLTSLSCPSYRSTRHLRASTLWLSLRFFCSRIRTSLESFPFSSIKD